VPLHPFDDLLVLLLTTLFLGLLIELARLDDHPGPLKNVSQPSPKPLRPRTPNDCSHCRAAAGTLPATPARVVVPYAQRKSPRGPLREKHVDTRGQACPNPDCDYHNVADPAVHALVGYGRHTGTCAARKRGASVDNTTPSKISTARRVIVHLPWRAVPGSSRRVDTLRSTASKRPRHK